MKIYIGSKKHEYYKDLLMMVDLGMHEKIAETLVKEIKPGANILDLGSGQGALSQRLVDLGYNVISVDKDENNFKCRGAQFVKVNFDKLQEVESFVTKYENYFDAVIGIEVIEHVENQWEYIRTLYKMCKPGGCVIISTPNVTSWLSRLNFVLNGKFHQFGDADLEYGHISPLTSWEFELILKRTGFKNIKLTGIGTLPPIYITSIKTALASFLMLPLRLIMKGQIDGWCIMAVGRK